MTNQSQTILVTGGAGYIGSHVCKALKKAGFIPVTFDNLSHGHEWAIRWGPFFYGDLQNNEDLDKAFTKYQPHAVIHLAGSIHLRESIIHPEIHYFNNVIGTLSLLKAMIKHQVTSLVFSSSAAVYAPPEYLPLDENHPKAPVNPYGNTKWIMEQIFQDYHNAHGLNTVSLRYFNAAGADPDGEIGESHNPETHLIPRVIFTAQGKQDFFTIFNNKLNTRDGTAIRDYVHVSDLASGHIAALNWLEKNRRSETFNLGTGNGKSVLEVIETVEKLSGASVNVKIENRHIAELPILIADPTKAFEILLWKPIYSDLFQIVQTAWAWYSVKTPLFAEV